MGARRRPGRASKIDLDKAKAEGKVVLYTSLDTQIVDAINAAFKQKYGIDVQYFRGGSSDVTSKVLAEADAGRPQADMVDASDLAALLLMKERGLLRAFKSSAIDAVAKELRDPDGTWITDRLTQAVIQFNTKEFGVDAARRPGPISARSPWQAGWSTSPAPTAMARRASIRSPSILGWDVVKAMAATKPLARADAAGHHASAGARRTRRRLPAERQHRLALQIAGQADATTSSRPKAYQPRSALAACCELDAAARSRPLLRVVDGAEGQAILVKGGKYSSRIDVAPPEGSTPLAKLKLLTLDYAEYSENKGKILDQMASIFRRRMGQLSSAGMAPSAEW